MVTASLEEYLKAIYVLIMKNSFARVTDIAETLNVSKSSVNRAIKTLKLKLLIDYENYGDIKLTKIGTEVATDILKRHNTIKAFLVNVLEVDSNVAEQEAKSMKHSISEDTINKLEKYINCIIDVGKLDCNYNPQSDACKSCVKITAKNRIKNKANLTKKIYCK
ncbi:MAG: metal-dependent transcriptional regulator [Clostridia bacterium]